MTKLSGKIEGAKNSLVPTISRLWFDASLKLEEAQAAIDRMEKADDRVSYEEGWTQFVDSIEEFWVRFFDEGKNTFSNFRPWAGKHISARKKGLFQYLYQSRHKSQHERLKLDWTEARLQIAPGFFGGINLLNVNSDGSFEGDVLSTSQNELKLVHHYGDPILPTIENRGQEFKPPTVFESERLDGQPPHQIANIALNYYSSILAAALEKFGR